MPYLDGTGPNGRGPKTGRGLGNCANSTVKSRFIGGFGRGLGLFRRSNTTNLTEKQVLEEDKRILEERLKKIEDQLRNL